MIKDLVAHSENFLSTLKPQTYKAYSGDILHFVNFLTQKDKNWENYGQRLSDSFKAFLLSSGKTESSVYRTLVAVKSLYRHIESNGVKLEEGFRYVNLIEPPARDKSGDIIPDDLLHSIIEQVSERDIISFRNKIILILLIHYGLKRSEITNLKVGDILKSGDDVFLKIKKRQIVLKKETAQKLEIFLDQYKILVPLMGHENYLIQRTYDKVYTRSFSPTSVYRILITHAEHLPSQYRPINPEKVRFNQICREVKQSKLITQIEYFFGSNRKQIINSARPAVKNSSF